MKSKCVSGDELVKAGYIRCCNVELVQKAFDKYNTTHIILTNPNGIQELFLRHGNDWFSFVKVITNKEQI